MRDGHPRPQPGHGESDGVSGPRWLDPGCARTDAESRYVARLAQLLPAAAGDRVSAHDVGQLQYGGVCAWITLPHVPAGEWPVIANTLQVLYDGRLLGAYWGCAHLWDEYDEQDPEHLHVDATALTPERAAEVAAGWLARQLRRPLVRQEWDRRALGPALRWVLTDTGTVLGSRGRVLGRARRPPDRVIPLT